MNKHIYIGFDSREVDGYAVTRQSIEDHRRLRNPRRYDVHPIILNELRRQGLYTRQTTKDVSGRLYDVVSQHQMSTEFAISRFFVPHMMKQRTREGDGPRLALFMDSDMLVTCDLDDVFSYADPAHAVTVVKHDYQPPDGIKMDNQVQSQYERKNWSSVILWNIDHPAHRHLTIDLLNTTPGRDLHRFCWLKDEEIGTLPHRFNVLLGHDPDPYSDWEANFEGILHFTEGLPSMGDRFNEGHAANLWWRTLHKWAHA